MWNRRWISCNKLVSGGLPAAWVQKKNPGCGPGFSAKKVRALVRSAYAAMLMAGSLMALSPAAPRAVTAQA